MKLTILTTLILLSFAGQAQTRVEKDASGNYSSVKKAADTAKTAQVAIFTDSKGKA
jgi:hypothetical protein